VTATFCRLAYRGGDGGGLEPVECGLQAPIIAIWLAAQMRMSASQMVAMP
jgi:hypothetical protein